MRFTVSVWVVWFQVAFGLLLLFTSSRCGMVVRCRFGGNAVGCAVGYGSFLAKLVYCFYAVKRRFQVAFYCCGNQTIYCHKIAALRLPEKRFLIVKSIGR